MANLMLLLDRWPPPQPRAARFCRASPLAFPHAGYARWRAFDPGFRRQRARPRLANADVMIRSFLRSLLILPPCALALMLPLHAQELALEMDPAQSKVEFTLGDVLHTVRGSFQLKRGAIRFDPAPARLPANCWWMRAAGPAATTTRDRKMHKEILESSALPGHRISPRPRGRQAGAARHQPDAGARGVWDSRRQNTNWWRRLRVHVNGGQYDITAHFSVPYQKWGIKNPSTLFLHVEDKVDITLHTVAHQPTPVPSQ
jgi:hypothetical protein